MADHAPFLPGLSPVHGKPVHVAFDGGRLTSDAGVLVLAEIERRLGLAERLARCIEDPRAPERVRHGLAEMIRFRALMIAAGYADANDCDALRGDPAFKMAVGACPRAAPSCARSRPCGGWRICRPDHRAQAHDGRHGRAVLRQLRASPRRIVLDIDDTVRHRCTATSSYRCSTPITTSAAFCRSTSMMRRGKPVAVILRPGKTPDGAEVALVLRHVVRAIRTQLAPSSPPGRDPDPRRQPLQPARGAELAGAPPGRLHLRPRWQQAPVGPVRRPAAEDAAYGPDRGRGGVSLDQPAREHRVLAARRRRCSCCCRQKCHRRIDHPDAVVDEGREVVGVPSGRRDVIEASHEHILGNLAP